MTSSKKRDKRSSDQEYRETPGQIAGLFLSIIGGAGLFLLAVSPWDWFNAVTKVLGFIASGAIVAAGRILLLPPEKRRRTLEQILSRLLGMVRAAWGLMTRQRNLDDVY